MSEILYDCRWSDKVDEKFIDDFIATQRAVFNNNYSKELFIKKYVDNIYGKSVVEVVYLDEQPVAARGLWRNDIYGKSSYQPGDTCVTEICRGKGIFTEMTKRSIDFLSKDDIIYNFPNQNSFPGYMKMGWRLVNEYGLVVLLSVKEFLKEHPIKMDKQYADWWLEGNKDFLYTKKGGEFFLLRPLRRFCYKVCACVDEEIAKRYPKKNFGVCFYRSTKKTFYNKKIGLPLHVVSKQDINYIPIWKIDAL